MTDCDVATLPNPVGGLVASREGPVEIRRSVLVPYSAEGMFDLIERAELYPQFLPWCTAATILERDDDWVGARIEFCYFQIRFSVQTRNPKRRPEWLQVRLVDGPFRRFHGDWILSPLGTLGCKVSFDLSYEIAAGLFDRLTVRAIDIVTRSMVDAFVKRAEETLTVEPAPAIAVSSSPGSEPPAILASGELS
ncbi:MAG: type II toxin-antitoxin system RatA family toxin [Croceibacterium sp.]